MHGAVFPEEVEFPVDFRQAGGEEAVGKEVGLTVDFGKSHGGNAVFVKVAPPAVNILPAGQQSAVPEEIASVLQPEPAGDHGAVAAKVAGVAVDDLPAGGHDAGAAEVVCNAIDGLPAQKRDAAIAEAVASLRQIQPAGYGLCVKIAVISDSVLFRPAAAIHVIVVPVQAAGDTEDDDQ